MHPCLSSLSKGLLNWLSDVCLRYDLVIEICFKNVVDIFNYIVKIIVVRTFRHGFGFVRDCLCRKEVIFLNIFSWCKALRRFALP